MAQVAFLAAAYFGAAKLAVLVAIPPGYATAIWPGSGIAVAALLLAGNRLWPGVWIGSVAANLTIEGSIFASAVIATGSALQAVTGAELIRRYTGVPSEFRRAGDVVKLFGLAALTATALAVAAVVDVANAVARTALTVGTQLRAARLR